MGMTKGSLKNKTTEQLLKWTNFYHGKKLDMLMNEITERLDPEVFEN